MTWEDFKKNKEGENFTNTRWEEFKVNREKRKEEKLLQEQEMQNIEQSFIPTLNEDGYLTTGKTYGDYFYNNYGLYKDTPIFAKDNKFYLYSNDKYQELGQLDKKGNVITENIMTTKELEDKELEEAKKLGYKGSKVEGVTSKEYDNAQAAFDKLKKEFKLSDKELEDFKKTGNLSKKHISIQTGSMDKTKEAAENYAKKIRNGEIQQYTYELSPSDKVFLDTNKITGDQRKNYINFLGGKPINIRGEKEGTYFKKPNRFEDGWDAGDLTLTLGDTLNLTVANLLGGVGNWIEGGSDTLFNLLGTSLEMAGNTSGKKDVTKDLNGKKVTKYKWGDQIFWFDPENNKLYDDNDTEIPYFNIKNLIKVQEYNDAIADFGRFMKDEVNKSNEMHDFFLNNDITNKFREGSFLGSKSEALIESTGQTLPSIGVGMAGAGPGTNAALIFGTTYGQSKAQHIQSGETEEQARMNAFIEASAETISEQFFEGIPGMKTANWGDDLTKALTYGAKEYFGTKAGKIVKKLLPVLGEGFEEIISNSIVAAERTFIGNLFPEYGFNESGLPEGILENMLEQLTTSDSWEQFFGAIITSSILNGGSAIINTKTRNEIIKAYADDNNITFEEAKQELNLFEIGTEFEPADIKLNENDTVSINNVELTEDKIKDIMKRFIIMSETITDEQSLNKLQNAVNQLSDAYEQLQTKKSEKIKEQEKLKESEKLNEPKKEKLIEIKEEQKEPTKDTSQDTQQLINTIQENEAKLEQLKSNQTQNEDQVKKLEQELNALESEKENKDLVKQISKQRAVVEDYQARFTREQKTFGLTEDTLKLGKQAKDAKTYLQKLIDQQKQQKANKDEQITKLKQEIEDLKSKDNTKEIEKLEKQIKEDKNKQEEKLSKDEIGADIEYENELEIKTNEDYVDVLKEMPVRDEKIKEQLDKMTKATNKNVAKIMTQFVDSNYPFEQLARKANNKTLLPALNDTSSSNTKAQSDIATVQRDLKGNVVGKGLNEIFKPIENAGLTYEFGVYMYLSRQATKATGRSDVFGEKISSTDAKELIKDMEKQFPEFKEYKKDVLKYEKNLRNMMVESSLISQKTSDYLEELYPEYVRIYREVYSNKSPIIHEGNRIRVASPVKTATGGTQNLIPLKEALARQTLEVNNSAYANQFGLELNNILGSGNTNYNKENIKDNLVSLNDGDYGYVFYENGKQKTVRINEAMKNALTESKLLENDLLTKTVGKASAIQRGLITNFNMLFAIKNISKDLFDAVINTENPTGFLKNYPKAWIMMITSNELWKQYVAMGGMDVSVFDYNKGFLSDSNLKKIVKSPIKMMQFIGEHAEQVTRFAEFLNTISSGGTLSQAMFNAAEVTVNFKKGGKITRQLGKYGFNYLNASILGAYKAYENIANRKGGKTFIKYAVQLAALSVLPAIANSLMYGDDDDYEALSDDVKNKNYVFKIGDGKFLKIPKGRLSSIISNIPQKIVEGKNVTPSSYLNFALEQIGPSNPIESNLYYPLYNVIKNGNNAKNYFGSNIIPTRYKNKTLEDQRNDPKITYFAKKMSEITGMSPFLIDYLYDNYSGFIGDVTTPWMTEQADKNVFESTFIADSITNNQNVNDLYDLEEKYAYPKTEDDLIRSKYLNNKTQSLSDYYTQIRKIQVNEFLTNSEKNEQINEIRTKLNDFAKEAVETIKNEKVKNKTMNGISYKQIGTDYLYKYNEDEKKWEKVNIKSKEYKQTIN